MRPAIARLLVVIASVPFWLGIPYSFLMPVVSYFIAADGPDPLITYSITFGLMYGAWWILVALWSGVVSLLAFIVIGSGRRADLIIESKLDQPEVRGLIDSGEYTAQSLGNQLHAELKGQRPLHLIMAIIMTSVLFLIGLGVTAWLT